ncbi:hypothetical protein Tco_1344654 [Tanacetum coccineum]
MEHDQRFTEFNIRAARQVALSAEVRMRAEYNIKEKRKLRSVVDKQTDLLKVRDGEIENLKAQLLLKEVEVAEAIRLRAKASKFEAIEKSLQDEVKVLRDHNTALEKEKSELNVKAADLAASVKVREREVADLDAQVHELETSSARLQEKFTTYENYMGKLEELQDEWLLTYGMKLAIVKCLHSPEYMFALGATISRAIEKGMQDGLAVGITHGQEGRVLTDVAMFNPFTKSDYISALLELQDVNFSLLAELKSNKDASTETLMNILRLEEPLAERLGLMSRNLMLTNFEPLSYAALEGTKGTFGTSPETTTALSVTFASVSSIPPISIDDYDVMHADGQEGGGADANPFPNVGDAELNIE